MLRTIFSISLIFTGLVFSATAQTPNFTAYSWDAANLTLAYPADWDSPVAAEQDGRLTLQMAQTLAGQPDTRPPGIPIIHLILISNDIPEVDLTPYIAENFNRLGISPAASMTSTLVGFDAVITEGNSEDGLLFGIARAVQLPDNHILLVIGRAVEAQRESFSQLFEDVANSIVLGAGLQPAAPAYGVLWNVIRTGADGENAFLNLTGIAYSPNGKLFTADPNVGLIEFDGQTGMVLATHFNEQLVLPSTLAVNGDNTVYIGDTVCECIHIFNPDGSWDEPINGFSVESPASIAIAPDGAIYATDQADTGIQVQVIRGDDKQVIELGIEVSTQPLLAVDPTGQVLALTPDGLVLPIGAGDFSALYTLNMPSALVNQFSVDSSHHFVLATRDRGVLIVDNTGEAITGLGRIVANNPLPGEFVSPQGVALGTDGTIYISDSDGTFGSITAMNSRVAAGRVGSTVLVPGVSVGGTLNNEVPQQDWIFNGVAGQVLTISAVDASETGILDVGLRLIAPDGQEEAANDDQNGIELATVFDAQISNHVLASSGRYTIRVERVEGSGTYRLGIVQELPFTLNDNGPTQLRGSLEGALPKQLWTFEGSAGRVLTVTMQTESGTLDPLVRLLDSNGTVIAENDDAADSALGKNAQLVRVALPINGVYTLEAARFSGEGDYSLIILITS